MVVVVVCVCVCVCVREIEKEQEVNVIGRVSWQEKPKMDYIIYYVVYYYILDLDVVLYNS